VIGARAVGGVLLAIGVVCLVATLDVGDDWSPSGPRLAPAVASVLLIALAVVLVARPGEELVLEPVHWPTPLLLVALLIGYALVLSTLGYALATTIFFWLAAWLLGSEVVLGVVTSYAFSHWLNVQLPTGPWGV
jgi:uncharacterized membrane protein AbrB (regulator of aidB expression)